MSVGIGVVLLCEIEVEMDIDVDVDDETGLNGFESELESILLSLISGLYIESTSCN